MFAEFRTQLLRFLASDRRALFNAGELQGRPIATTAPADGESLAWSDAENKYVPAAGGGGGAPTTAHYVVKTANAGLSAERVLTDSASVTWDWTTPGQVSATAAGGSSTKGTATLDFGSFPGSSEASVAVTGQTGISETSRAEAFIMGDDTTADKTASDHKYLPTLIGLSCGTPSAGTGFTIYGRCLDKLQGTFKVRWAWSD